MILEPSTGACRLMCQPFGLSGPNWIQVSGAYRPRQRVCQPFGLETAEILLYAAGRTGAHAKTRRKWLVCVNQELEPTASWSLRLSLRIRLADLVHSQALRVRKHSGNHNHRG